MGYRSKRFNDKNGERDKTKGRKTIGVAELVEDVKRVIEITGGDTRIATYKKVGLYSSNTVVRNFEGSWSSALSAAGVDLNQLRPLFGDERRSAPRAKPVDPEVEMRLCLGFCGKMFLSRWKGNRVCQICSGTAAYTDPPAEMFYIDLPSRGYKNGGSSDVGGY